MEWVGSALVWVAVALLFGFPLLVLLVLVAVWLYNALH